MTQTDTAMQGAPETERKSARGFGWAFGLSLLLLILTTLIAAMFMMVGLAGPNGERILQVSFHLTGRQDFPWLALATLLLPVVWIAAKREATLPGLIGAGLPAGRALGIAAAVFAVVWAGTFLVYFDFPLSMDEFMMRYQSALVQAGHLLAPAPDAWFPLSSALRPDFLIVDREFQYWAPGYRPGTAFVHAVMSMVGTGSLMNALFCAASVMLVWALARRVLGDQPGAVFWAVVLFATGAQFLITGMSPYTMTAHLFFSLLWLWLFVQDRVWAHVAAMAVGAYALGLHHLHVHATLAFPFLFHLFFLRRRFALALAYGAVYAVVGLGWVFWMDVAEWLSGMQPVERSARHTDGGADFVAMAVSQGMGGHSSRDFADWAVNVTRLIAWQNLAVLPLFLIGIRAFRDMPLMLKLMCWSILTSLIPYILLMPSQGHGWGYRYLHQVMGHLALVAAFGWTVAREHGAVRMQRFVVMLAVASVVIALPLRSVQTRAFVAPFATAMAEIRAQDADLVFLDETSMWTGVDLVRNDPLLRNRPIVLAVSKLDVEEMARLCEGRSAVFLGWEELRHTGMAPVALIGQREPDARQTYRSQLQETGCIGADG